MKNILTFLASGLLLILIACNGQNEKKTESQQINVKESTSEKIYYYTCPMENHKYVHSDKPGNCPECGMKLVAVVAAEQDSAGYYGCMMPEDSDVRSDEPGNCPKCNMKLVPMLKKNEEMM